MILDIDTSDQRLVKVFLKEDGEVLDSIEDNNQFGSQILLPLINKLMEKNKKSLEDLEEIEVNRGPGSFTGLRVGVSTANALGYALGIPVNGKKIETELKYD